MVDLSAGHSRRLERKKTPAIDAGKSTPDLIADAISRRILARSIGVGQRLVEIDLMQEFNIGRSTVREALRILGERGMVELTRHRGAVVCVLSHEDAANLLEVLEVLSGLCARLAALKIDRPGNRKRFLTASARVTRSGTDHDAKRVVDERARFHQVLFDLADNPELDRILPTGRSHLFRNQFYRYLTIPDINSMVDEYRAIAKAVLAGDGAAAEAAMRNHITRTGRRTLPRVDDDVSRI